MRISDAQLYCLYALLVLTGYSLGQETPAEVVKSFSIGPVFCFGQNIINAKELIVYGSVVGYKGPRRSLAWTEANFLYGINDRSSCLLTVPYIFKQCDQSSCSSGISDMSFQFEAAYYDRETKESLDQGTVVFGLFAPTGSDTKQPPTGFGSPTVFLGTTFYHISDWYLSGGVGGLFPTSKCGKRLGRTVLYESCVGYRVIDRKQNFMFLHLELNGIVNRPDRICGEIDQETESHLLFFGPSIFAGVGRLIIEAGIQGVIHQRRANPFDNFSFRGIFVVGWKIQF